MAYHHLGLFLLMLALHPLKGHSWGWFSSSSSDGYSSGARDAFSNGFVAKFSMEGINNRKGAELVEDAKRKSLDTNSCWQNAYRGLLVGCSEGLAEDEKRSRFAWHLSDCFQTTSGRSPFPYCDMKSSMDTCRKKLDDSELSVYLAFYLDTNHICHQLQAYAFKLETERLVNNLKESAEHAEDRLEAILERSNSLSKSSEEIHSSLISIDHRTLQLAQASKSVEGHIEVVLNHSEAIYEQSQGIAAAQLQLQQGQSRMKEQFEEGMVKIQDSHGRLGQAIEKLKSGTLEIEKEITRVRDGMFLKMENLQGKADDIGNIAGISLEKQKQLLDGQSSALEGLQFLTKFQTEALDESRTTLQRLAEYSSSQQQELLHRQKQLHEVHDRLVENSRSILAAQEAFEAKQATMFLALDRLFSLHNAMLLESRLIKAFFIYALLIFIIYMFTSTKQTYNVRPWLYIGLCTTFSIEILVIRFTSTNMEQQTNIITLFRSLFALLAAAQLLYAIFTYRDYEVLNHQMLQTLVEKVNGMQMENELAWELDSDVEDWSQWIDAELLEEVDSSEDPDYKVPGNVKENSISTSIPRKYNLRQRHHR